ncbi:hypothetical protein CO660_30950 [Rhizobium sp. L9]|nr:hypothetical protein CO660_30950 [Rhizobium sp. L9]
MPLTLALSPLAGRGDVPCESLVGTESLRHGPFAPFTGRRWRQPDEGPPSSRHHQHQKGPAANGALPARSIGRDYIQ